MFEVVTLACLAAGTLVAQTPKDQAEHDRRLREGTELFQKQVRPILVKQCVQCHGGEAVKGDLDLTTRAGLVEAKAITASAKTSALYRVVAHLEEPKMPWKLPKLAEPEIAAIAAWIDLGAPYDKPLAETKKAVAKAEMQVTAKDRDYWAFRPLKKPTPPEVGDAAWRANPIDRFVRTKLDQMGIPPAPPIDRAGLIRRAHFDLTGLPPTPEEVAAFLAAPDLEAATRDVVAKLLASPAYGERWARHWLDAARYGESHGFEHDYDRPFAYHYRDFVIKALNQDLPGNCFLEWQLAGDQLAPNDPLAWSATGFLAAGVYPTQITTSEAERVRYDAMDDMLATTGNAMLGLTIGCARCHDHKYDPIPTRDYYRMLSTFTKTVRAEIEWDFGTPEEKAARAAWDAEQAKLAAAVKDHDAKKLPKDSAYQAMLAAQKAHEAKKPKETKQKIQVASENVKPMRHHTATGDIPDFYPETFLLKRGDVTGKEGVMSPGVLQLLGTPKPITPQLPARSALAKWVTDVDRGAGALSARVMVNRVWAHHFGRGLVSTINDFGLQGEKPTHPELLEWLAADFVENGWSLKRLHTQIVQSRTYRLGGERNEQANALDADGKWLSHRSPRRLEAEAIRDNLLAVSGRLDATMYGPGTLSEAMNRRSIYFQVKRSQLIPMLQVFDWPDSLTSAAMRPTTVIAPQALVFMNHPQVRESARRFAERFLPNGNSDLEAGVDRAYRLAFGRDPSAEERALGVAFLKAGEIGVRKQEYALALLSLNEFIFVR